MVTTLGAAFAAAAVAVVAVFGFWMTTFWADALVAAGDAPSSTRVATPAPAPPPMRAPATRPAMPIRSRPPRRGEPPPAGERGASGGGTDGYPEWYARFGGCCGVGCGAVGWCAGAQGNCCPAAGSV